MFRSKQVKVLVILLALFLVVQFSLASAQQEIKEIGDKFGLPKEKVIVSEVDFVKEKEGILFTFGEGGFIKMEGYSYENIKKGGKVKLDFQATPVWADFVSLGGKYKFPKIPEFELKEETKILFSKGTLTIFSEEVEKLRVTKTLSKKVCNRKCAGFKVGFKEWNCWKIEERFIKCDEESEEELIEKGIFKKKDDQLFLVDRYHVEKKVLFYFPSSQVDLTVIKDYVNVSDNKFSGSNFKINEMYITGIKEIPGEITVEEEGFFLRGVANYRKVEVIGKTFLEPKEEPINKSWVKISHALLEAKSIDPLYIRILGGNELFDASDTLTFILEGDYIKVTSRKLQNLIPLIEHQGVIEGKTEIETGIFNFTLEKGQLQIKKVPLIKDFIEKLSKNYLPWAPQSVAFELSSNLIEDKRLIVGSNNNYVLSLKPAEGRLIMNPWGIPVTNSREHNLLREVKQLEQKWKEKRGIEFEERSIPDPGTVQLVNYWLERHPEVKLDRIIFMRDLNAFAAEMPTWEKNKKNEIVMGVGTWIMDPYSVQYILGEHQTRPFEPLKVLDHEYQHAQEFYLKREDYTKIKEKARREAERLIRPEDYVKLFLDEHKREAKKFALYASKLKGLIKEQRYDVLKSATLGFYYCADGFCDIPESLARKYDLPINLKEIKFEEWGELPDNAVKEIAALALEKMERAKRNEEWQYSYRTKEFKENREKFLKDYEGYLLFYKQWALNEKTKEVMKSLGEREFKIRAFNYIGALLNKVGDESFTQLKEDLAYRRRIEKIRALLEERAREKPPGLERERFEQVLEKIKIENSPIEIVTKLWGLSKDDGLIAKESLLLQKEVEKYVPAVYSFRKYPDPIHGKSYEELLTTLVELPDEERLTRARFYPNYKKLEQILFDTGSIFTSPEFYQKIFGPCRRADCLDKRCVIYKGECCKKFPRSPNC